jgi:hypothetical protein
MSFDICSIHTSGYNHSMSVDAERLDGLMERASEALAGLDYLKCEALCLEALCEARAQKRYGFYARVLLPLQEARRQRRMIAAEGEVILGTPGNGFDVERWLVDGRAGCVVLTHPSTAEDARVFAEQVREKNLYVEVLFADNPAGDGRWMLRSCEGAGKSGVVCELDAPRPGDEPAEWFLNATERLGDAVSVSIDDKLTGEALVYELEVGLGVFADHELLHQRLARAAGSI